MDGHKVIQGAVGKGFRKEVPFGVGFEGCVGVQQMLKKGYSHLGRENSRSKVWYQEGARGLVCSLSWLKSWLCRGR